MKRRTVPLHISLIPDGNRRWAVRQGLKKTKGYSVIAYDFLEGLFLEAKRLGIEYFSFWGFSTENWNRPKKEIDFLFNHFLKNSAALLNGAIKYKIGIKHIGRKDRLPKKVVQELKRLEEATENYQAFTLQLCMDYGGRDELIRAVNKIIQSGVKEINEKQISSFLDTDDVPDPDLIIRTSGEQRTSGFMPYQSTYAELYFSSVYFPDFGPEQLREAVEEFARRKRNFGA